VHVWFCSNVKNTSEKKNSFGKKWLKIKSFMFKYINKLKNWFYATVKTRILGFWVNLDLELESILGPTTKQKHRLIVVDN